MAPKSKAVSKLQRNLGLFERKLPPVEEQVAAAATPDAAFALLGPSPAEVERITAADHLVAPARDRYLAGRASCDAKHQSTRAALPEPWIARLAEVASAFLQACWARDDHVDPRRDGTGDWSYTPLWAVQRQRRALQIAAELNPPNTPLVQDGVARILKATDAAHAEGHARGLEVLCDDLVRLAVRGAYGNPPAAEETA